MVGQLTPDRPWRPWAVVALLVVLALAFVMQCVLHVGEGTSLFATNAMTAVMLGGLTLERLAAGELWRLLAYAFLHSGLSHLLVNALPIAIAGALIERVWGRAAVLVVFLAGVLGGAAAFVASGPPTVVIGASGGALGMLGAGLFAANAFPMAELRWRLRASMALLATPGLLPILAGESTNMSGHIGGLIAGCVVGAFIALYRRKPGREHGFSMDQPSEV